MSAEIEERDLQVAHSQAWHRQTTIVEGEITREVSMPYEVIPADLDIVYESEGDIVSARSGFKQLIASDDKLPIAEPYNPSTYTPSSVELFWNVLEEGLKGANSEVVSAGTVSNRTKLFASIKISDGFIAGDREFKDYITLMDAMDRSMSLQASYSNICVVCANTFRAAMGGKTIGKARHSANFDQAVKKVVNSLDDFTNTSASFREMFTKAADDSVSKDDARAFFYAVEGRAAKEISNGLRQKVARMMELFEDGKGNIGENKLDAFSAVTEFHSHESTNRKEGKAQYNTSEFGSSAVTKTYAVKALEDWDSMVERGRGMVATTGANT